MKKTITIISLVLGFTMISCKNVSEQFGSESSDSSTSENRLNTRTGDEEEIKNEEIADQTQQGLAEGMSVCEVDSLDMSGGKWVGGVKVLPVVCGSDVKATTATYVFCQKNSLGDLECAPFLSTIDLKIFGIAKAYTVNAANHAQCLQIAKDHSTAAKKLDCFVIVKTKSL